MENYVIYDENEQLFPKKEDMFKDSLRKSSTDDGDEFLAENGRSSLKERAPYMMNSIMAWLENKGVRMGNP